MTATTARPPFKRSQTPFSSTILVRPKSEILFEIFGGTLGRVQLGRMLSGNDVGRLVLLRELPGPPAAEFELEVEQVKSIAHPRLAKTLGIFRAAETWQLASEYISGVSLFELCQTIANRGEKMDPAVAARVMLDALEGLVAARELLPNAASTRCIFAESIWVADFGETFLAEVLSSALLARAKLEGSDETSSTNSVEDRDLAVAGLLLLELACGSTEPSALENPLVPTALRDVIARATGMRQAPRFTSLGAFVGALSALDVIASDDAVSEELRRLMGSVLEIRRQKLAMTERVAEQPSEQDETKFFRAAARNPQRDTARPPANPSAQLSAEAKIIPSPSLRIVARSEPPDDPTMIFRRPKEDEAPAPEPEASPRIEATNAPAPRDSTRANEAVSPSASAAPSKLGPALDLAPQKTGHNWRIAILLLLLTAAVAFFAASSATFTRRHAGVSPHPSWLRSELGKLRHWF
ncbi:MAG TPA: hypothetical protein VGM44_11885 [Polyangiaceae bacterium]|jgi:hypothetical protein